MTQASSDDPRDLLRIDTSPMGELSQSRRACDLIVDHIAPTQTIVRDLSANPPAFFNATWVNANFTPHEKRSEAQQQALRHSNELVDELSNARWVVIGAPIYNFGVPARLKAWIDMVTRVGRTFAYTTTGPKGLLTNKPVIIAVSSGGTVLGSDVDFATPYLKHLFGFIGITDVRFVYAKTLIESFSESTAKEILGTF